MKLYQFKSLGMLGEMYVDGEEAGIPEGEFYRAEDVRALLEDARTVAEWHLDDGDECGVIARRLFVALPREPDSE